MYLCLFVTMSEDMKHLDDYVNSPLLLYSQSVTSAVLLFLRAIDFTLSNAREVLGSLSENPGKAAECEASSVSCKGSREVQWKTERDKNGLVVPVLLLP